jgi:hypothetical protein
MASAHGRRRVRQLTGAETATGDCGRGDGGHGPGDAASDHGGRGASCRDDGGAREAAVGRVSGGRRQSARRVGRGRERRGPGSCRDARRAVPTAALSRCGGTARDGHAAAARDD